MWHMLGHMRSIGHSKGTELDSKSREHFKHFKQEHDLARSSQWLGVSRNIGTHGRKQGQLLGRA